VLRHLRPLSERVIILSDFIFCTTVIPVTRDRLIILQCLLLSVFYGVTYRKSRVGSLNPFYEKRVRSQRIETPHALSTRTCQTVVHLTNTVSIPSVGRIGSRGWLPRAFLPFGTKGYKLYSVPCFANLTVRRGTSHILHCPNGEIPYAAYGVIKVCHGRTGRDHVEIMCFPAYMREGACLSVAALRVPWRLRTRGDFDAFAAKLSPRCGYVDINGADELPPLVGVTSDFLLRECLGKKNSSTYHLNIRYEA
jgi:hypothetical protein